MHWLATHWPLILCGAVGFVGGWVCAAVRHRRVVFNFESEPKSYSFPAAPNIMNPGYKPERHQTGMGGLTDLG
jgi:hypothetical protein